MSENKNEKTKIEVPIFTYEEKIKEGKQLPRNYKICEEDKEEFLKHI